MIHGHEENVDGDAEGDEELGERIEDHDGQDFAHPDPDPCTIPDAKEVDALLQVFDQLPLPTVVVVVGPGRVGLAVAVDVYEGKVGTHAVDDLVENAQILQELSLS